MNDSVKSTKTTIVCCIIIGILIIGIAVYYALSESGFFSVAKTTPVPEQTPSAAPTQTVALPEGDTTGLVLIIHADAQARSIRVQEPQSGEEMSLYYTGAVNVTNRFGQTISCAQIDDGSIAHISYDSREGRVYSITLSNDDWVYENVSNLKINMEKGRLTVGGVNYRCSESTVFLCEGERFSPEELADVDVVNVRGVGDRVFVIELVQGHGTLYLMNEEEFIGGNLYIDDVFATKITQGTALAIREGSYRIAASNNELHGEKEIVINRNGTAVFDLSEYGPLVVLQGKVNFFLTPEYADLYIDDRFSFYTTGVLLDYGEHVITVSCPGYTDWNGKITVSSEEMDFTVSLGMIPTPSPTVLPTPTGSPEEAPVPTEAPDTDGPVSDSTSEATVEVQILWYPNSVVRIDSVYAGVTDAGGILTTDMSIGTHVVELIRTVLDGTTAPTIYTVEVDASTPVLSFPQG